MQLSRFSLQVKMNQQNRYVVKRKKLMTTFLIDEDLGALANIFDDIRNFFLIEPGNKL